jgi:Amt family ammonium transporter
MQKTARGWTKPGRSLLGTVGALVIAAVVGLAGNGWAQEEPLPVAATEAATPPLTAPTPSVEDRLASMEAYFNNLDGSKTLPGAVGPGHNAFIMVSAALVLFMTLPGLALFYGGLVRRKNVLSVMAQCLGIAGMVTVLWWAVGYSLVFSDVGGAGGDKSTFLGDLSLAFLQGVGGAPNSNYSYWISHSVFSMYQLMFAIITPALIVGAIAERIKYTALMAFLFCWMFVVYFPLAHMVWGIDGFMNGVWNASASIKAIDFAGGTVVHMSSGWSALILCLLLGKRIGFTTENMAPHSMVLCMVGTGMLWVGWYGFNAGSALAADGIASGAFMTTTLATGVAAFTWAILEKVLKGKPSVLGYCSGAVAGLVVVTPAAGFVSATGSVIIGVCAGVVPFIFCVYLKKIFGYDDALDTFGVHAVGGTLGAILTGLLASPDVNANLNANLKDIIANGTLVVEQLKAVGLTLALSIGGTLLIALPIKALIGLRPEPEEESMGLDISDHGEEGYVG